MGVRLTKRHPMKGEGGARGRVCFLGGLDEWNKLESLLQGYRRGWSRAPQASSTV